MNSWEINNKTAKPLVCSGIFILGGLRGEKKKRLEINFQLFYFITTKLHS